MVKNPRKLYPVELTIPYGSVVLGATYNAGVANTYCDYIQEGQGSPLERKKYSLKEKLICKLLLVSF